MPPTILCLNALSAVWTRAHTYGWKAQERSAFAGGVLKSPAAPGSQQDTEGKECGFRGQGTQGSEFSLCLFRVSKDTLLLHWKPVYL